MASGKVDLGVLDIHDLAIAREPGTDVVAVGALVGKPLAALIAQPDVRRPRDLEGRTVGVSGLPSDPAFVRAIVEHDGGDFDAIRQVTIGFNAVSRLLTKRVDARAGVLERRGRRGQAARPGRAGVPRRGLRRAAVSRGGAGHVAGRRCARARADRAARCSRSPTASTRPARSPDEAVARIAKAAETDDTALVRAQLDAVLPLFADGLKLDREVLEQWADFDVEIGLVKERPDVDRPSTSRWGP